MAAVVRLERELARTRSEGEHLRADVASMQRTLSSFEKFADDLGDLRRARSILKMFGVVLATGILAFIVQAAIQTDRLKRTSDDLTQVQSKQEFVERGMQTIDTNVRSLSSSIDEWRKSEERRLDTSERRLEKLEERKRR